MVFTSQLSFEFFPPKTAEGVHKLTEATQDLAHYQPQFFSVTFGAGGSTRVGTIETVQRLQKMGQHIAPHLACIGSTREEILDILQTYHTLGVRHLVALRGDLPSGMGQAGEFKFATDLITLIREEFKTTFHIEVAAYPELHPQAKSVHDDVLNLKRKYQAGANSAITQYFFNPDAYFYYIEDCAREHINMPIIPGIMPITQFSNLARFSDLCGAEIPRWIRKRLESYGDDVEAIKQFGFEVVYQLCERLLAGGAPGLHFYTLNKSQPSIAILKALNIVPAGKIDQPRLTAIQVAN